MLLIAKEKIMNKADILVSGATGRTGGAAIAPLLEMGKRIRAYVRSDDERAAALRQRGVDIAVGDFADIDHIRAAMEGISSAYFLHPIAPGIISAAAYFAQAAKEAGVTAIVNMSQISARRASRSHAARDHWVSERVFDWSGVARHIFAPPSLLNGSSIRISRRRFGPRRRTNFPSKMGVMPRSARGTKDGSSPTSLQSRQATKVKFTPSMVRSR